MSYIKHNFQSGAKLYASDLNEMDEQIYKNESDLSELGYYEEKLKTLYSDDAYKYTNSYWYITNAHPLHAGTEYILAILPKVDFTLSVKIGTDAIGAHMVDVICEDYNFEAGIEANIPYTPSQDGLRAVLFFENADNIESIKVYTVETIKRTVVEKLTELEASNDEVDSILTELESNIGFSISEEKVLYTVPTKSGDGNFLYVLNSTPLIPEQEYEIRVMPNTDFTQKIQIGISGNGMVDVLFDDYSFVSGVEAVVRYTPSQDGLRVIRIIGSNAKLDYFHFYKIKKTKQLDIKDKVDSALDSTNYLVKKNVENVASIKRLENVVNDSIDGLLSIKLDESTTKTATVNVGEHLKAYVHVGLHYGSNPYTERGDELYFDGSAKKDLSDIRFFDSNGKILKAKLGKLVNLDFYPDSRLNGVIKVSNSGLIVVYNEGIKISKDNGNTFTLIPNTSNVTEHGSDGYNRKSIYPVFVDNDDNIFGYAGGKLYKLLSSNGYATINEVCDFTFVSNGVTVYPDIQNHGFDMDINGNMLFGCYQDTKYFHVDLFRSSDNGNTWTKCYTSDGGEMQHVHHIHADRYTSAIYVGVDDSGSYFKGSRILKTIDGGISFTEITDDIKYRGKDYYPTYFGDGFKLGGAESYVMGSGTIYRSEDDVNLDVVVNGAEGVRSFSDFGDESLIICGSSECINNAENHLLISEDKGKTWESIYTGYQTGVSSGQGWRDIQKYITLMGDSEPCIVLPKDSGKVPTIRIYKGGNHWYREAIVEIENTTDSDITIHAKTGYAVEYPYKSITRGTHKPVYEIPCYEGIGNIIADSRGVIANINGSVTWDNQESTHFGDYVGESTEYDFLPCKGVKFEKGIEANFGSNFDLNFNKNYTISFMLNTKELYLDGSVFNQKNTLIHELFKIGGVKVLQRNRTFGVADAKSDVREATWGTFPWSGTGGSSAASFMYSDWYTSVTIVVDSNNYATTYINGVKQANRSDNNVDTTTWSKLSDGDIVIGSSVTESLGYVSNIRVFDKALTDTEVMELYRNW